MKKIGLIFYSLLLVSCGKENTGCQEAIARSEMLAKVYKIIYDPTKPAESVSEYSLPLSNTTLSVERISTDEAILVTLTGKIDEIKNEIAKKLYPYGKGSGPHLFTVEIGNDSVGFMILPKSDYITADGKVECKSDEKIYIRVEKNFRKRSGGKG